MQLKPTFRRLITLVFLLLAGTFSEVFAQTWDDQALSFDGIGDYVLLNLNNTPIDGTGDFTVEIRFLSNVVNGYNLLFSLTDNTSSSLLTVGLLPGGQLALFWEDNSGVGIQHPFLVPTNPANLEGACHQLGISRQGSNLSLYLDGVPLAALSSFNGTYHFNEFRVGSDVAALSSSKFWDGVADEIRLWSVARSAAQIADAYDCVLSAPGTGPIADLEVYWPLDPSANQTTTPAGNNLSAVAFDESGHLNHGSLTPFSLALGSLISNFILSTCPLKYGMTITDLQSQSTALVSICDGSAAHFCVTQSSQPITAPPNGATVSWWYLDAGTTVPQMVTSSIFTGVCFGVPSGVIDISSICAVSATGYVDRTYWARIDKAQQGSNLVCTYATSKKQVRIYCPVTNASLVLNPVIPALPLTVLCEGTNYTTTVSISSTNPFVPTAVLPNGDLGIQWYINGALNLSLTDLGNIPYTGAVLFPDLCFEAKIQNGVCPLLTAQLCIPVDKDPACDLIDAKPELALIPDPNGGPYDYLLCPGNDLELMMLNSLAFQNCDPVWQYMFPSIGVWTDLNGASNITQNTNTLPNYGPGALPHPIWPNNETMILYRIECRPLHFPNSDCSPCHSNVVKITLKTPKPSPFITATQNPICKGGSTVISVSPYDPSCNYDWYCNGELVDNGPSLTTDRSACYWVEVFDGCFIQTSNTLNMEVCEVVPIIECPQDNPCACLGVPITLDGSSSYNTCGNTGSLPLQYNWIATSGAPLTATGVLFVHTPDPAGTTYFLTVDDPNIPGGCSAISQSFIITPCQ